MGEIKHLAQALSEFQKKCPTIQKNTQGYGYKYADLPVIIETINPILYDCKLTYTQLVQTIVGAEKTETAVKTILIHTESGENIESTVSEDVVPNTGKGMTPIQAKGSVITYLRRYALSSMLGIVTDEDIDGAETKQTPKATTQNTKPEVKWLSEENFKKVLAQKDKSKVQKAIEMYSKAPYGMKKEYKEKLTEHLKSLK